MCAFICWLTICVFLRVKSVLYQFLIRIIMAWCVVNFLSDNTVEVIPQGWLVDELNPECFWPTNYSRKKAYEAVLNKDSPACTWQVYKIKILGKYEDFQIAQRKCNRARENDDLSSNSENYQKQSLGKGCRARVTRKFNDYDISDADTNYDTDDDETNISIPLIPSSLLAKKKSNVKQATAASLVVPECTKSKDIVPESESITKNSDKENYNKLEQITHKMEKLEIDFKKFITENQEFQRQVLRQLIIINSRVKEHTENTEIIMKTLKKNENTEEVNDEQFVQEIADRMKMFPIDSEEKLNEIEECLKKDEEMEIMAKQLSLIGGETVRDITKRIMYQIINNCIGSLYSWEGAKGKKIFKNLQMAKLIIRAVRLNKNTKEATEMDIIKNIKDWLVRAKFREIKKSRQTDEERDKN